MNTPQWTPPGLGVELVQSEPTRTHGDLILEVESEQYVAPKKEELTCFRCGANKTCEFAWDDYNTGGDCLAEK